MFELYRKSQNAQYQWIRNHPVLWITSNVILAGVGIGLYEYNERRNKRRWQNETAQKAK